MQQRDELFLKGLRPVMFGLMGNVMFDAVEIRDAHSERAVTRLPGEISLFGERFVHPFGRVGLDRAKKLRDGQLFIQRD